MTVTESQRERIAKRTTIVGAIVNACLGGVKILVGVVGQSSALVADGIHSLSDLVCDLMVYVASHFSHIDADENHPYGHRRVETFATFALGIILVVVGAGIGIEAILQVLHHKAQRPDDYTIWAAIISIVANEFLFRYTLNRGKYIDSDLLRANAWHSRGDALSSIIVLIGLLGALAGWPFLDAIAALIVGILIIKIGLDWGWRSVNELMDEGVDEDSLERYKQVIQNTPGVTEMHQLRTRRMAEKVILDVHVLTPPYNSVSEGHYIAECVRFNLLTQCPKVKDVTVHIDVYDDDYDGQIPRKMPPTREAILKEMELKWHNIVGPETVLRVLLHYLDKRIEAEVVLDVAVLQRRGVTAEKLAEQFAGTAASSVLSSVRVLFTTTHF